MGGLIWLASSVQLSCLMIRCGGSFRCTFLLPVDIQMPKVGQFGTPNPRERVPKRNVREGITSFSNQLCRDV
ncbi:hypothetical protein GQ55_3G088200 [Panicum hallii var. hallii]|uniref:Secreted protein n=1 Tax=Panicum hallii var. hallii TaxID=1504633 RepID=A0A2T7E779_9POAL|nr:hypothetical protein GQ55_3G088200 [Panicum hallii var. hallii]